MMLKDIKNVLIVKLSAIGDVIHALPVSYAIKETYPEAKITWVVEPPAYDLLAMNPCVDRIIVFHKKDFKSLGGFLQHIGPFKKELQQESYDAVLDLQGLFKSAAIAYLAKAPVKLGMCNMRELSDKVSRPVIGPHAQGHIVERYLDVARAIGCRVDEVKFPLQVPEREQRIARALFEQAHVSMNRPYVVLAVGANWPNKRWPEDKFAALCDWLYQQQLIPVLVGGGPVDEQRATRIARLMEVPPVNLVGRTTFPQLTYIMQQAASRRGRRYGPRAPRGRGTDADNHAHGPDGREPQWPLWPARARHRGRSALPLLLASRLPEEAGLSRGYQSGAGQRKIAGRLVSAVSLLSAVCTHACCH